MAPAGARVADVRTCTRYVRPVRPLHSCTTAPTHVAGASAVAARCARRRRWGSTTRARAAGGAAASAACDAGTPATTRAVRSGPFCAPVTSGAARAVHTAGRGATLGAFGVRPSVDGAPGAHRRLGRALHDPGRAQRSRAVGSCAPAGRHQGLFRDAVRGPDGGCSAAEGDLLPVPLIHISGDLHTSCVCTVSRHPCARLVTA